MERPSLKLTFHESSRLRGRRQRGTNPVLGVDVEVREDVLERFCFRHLGAKEYDLLVIAGAVAFIDRKCRRRRSLGWSRDLHLRLPVHTPAFWRSAEVYRALCEVLVFLTGDNWSFEFRSRSSRVGFLSRQQSLGLSFNAPIVLPSSHGLDSFASSLLLKSDFPNTEIVRVVTKNRTLGASPDLGTVIELQVPVDIHVKGGEPTFRTRTFLFFTVAGIASATSGAISTNRSVIKGLLNHFKPLLTLDEAKFRLAVEGKANKDLPLEARLARRLPASYCRKYLVSGRGSEPEKRAHLITDFVAGMTDDFALHMYQVLEGIKTQ
jgi:hypothetical protein